MTNEQMLAEIARLKAENQALTKKNEKPITLKVSEKGALSIYGMGRFPITLYPGQFKRILGQEVSQQILKFIEDHAAEFDAKAKVHATNELDRLNKAVS